MEKATLLKAGLRSHRGSGLGIFALTWLVALALCSVLGIFCNSRDYLERELDRLGYGDLTVWVSGLPANDPAPLVGEIESLEQVAGVGVQTLVFTEYEIGSQESDSEGQLIVYDPQAYPYRFFSGDLSGYTTAPSEIQPGEVYVSPSMASMFGVSVGDTILFPIARSGGDVTLRVCGWFEDPFMGSSMIGMKGFLISQEDYEAIAAQITQAGHDSLARTGAMLHIAGTEPALTAAQFNALLHQNTSLSTYAEFSHSRAAISGFMLTLQNVFTALLLAFVLVLTLATVAVLSHSIGTSLEQDRVDLGILQTIGTPSRTLRAVQLGQYAVAILPGLLLGVALAVPTAALLSHMTLTTTGLLVPAALPWGLCGAALAILAALWLGFVWLRTGVLTARTPLQAIRGDKSRQGRAPTPLHQRGLGAWLAVRQLAAGWKLYLGSCLVAALLVFFASLTGRVNNWLGPNGEGLMDAFNPADLHIAAQPMGQTPLEEVEALIREYTHITDEYALAMPGVAVNGVDYTGNVITDPQRFHLLEGQTCRRDDEVVLTEFVAADLGVTVGDTVTVTGDLGSADFTVSGIYQCANDMGANIGMSREGYDRIGSESPQMWCSHYFLADPTLQPTVMEALEQRFGNDVYLHENSWPGLAGILAAMQALMAFLWATAAVFILVTTLLTTGKLLRAEQRNLAISRALGFSAGQLRRSFALRFLLAALAGSALGTAFSALLTDPLVAVLMRMEGISNFSSHPDAGTLLLPGAAVTALFVLYAWLASARIRRIPLPVLAAEP